MNHSWNIKRLGDICTSELGKTRDEKRNKGSFRPYLCAVNVQWDKFELSELKEMRFEDNEYDRYTIRKGDLVICEGGDIGRAAIWDKDEPIHYQNALHRVRFNEGVDSRFILYYLYFLKQTGILDGRYGKGVTIKHLVKSSLLSIPVPVPPIDEQQRIVFELDLLTDIIDKKNAQLRDLDTLAQSIFYEMFGDPSLNEKGWPVKNISDLFDVGSSKRVFESEWRDSGVPFYRAREIVRLSKGLPLEDPIFIEEALFSAYKEKYGIPATGDIMVTGVGTLGVCYLVKEEDCFYFKDGNTLWFRDKHIANSRFIKDQYSTEFVKDQIKGNSHGATVGTYTIVNAKKTRVICPPVELQDEYVEKVQVIDEQKQLIEDSIKDTQDLLDSRMHNYFD
jgi:type I restriction enzyme S subunit